jgi:hypothetical protein
MSDQPNAPPPGEGEPAPAAEPTPAPAPAPAPEGETPEQTPEQAAEAKSRGDRRFAELTAKLSAAQRDRDRLAAETEFLRRNIQQQPQQGQDTPEARYMREREAIRQEVEAKIRTETFHEQGASQFPDWRQRCDDLVKMGADPNFAQLLVEMPEGVRVAAALAADPAEVERIANLRTERARAVALGKYAATIEDAPGRAPAPRPVTNAPAPVRTVTGRASPTFNEYAADAQALVDKYMRDDLARRTKH